MLFLSISCCIEFKNTSWTINQHLFFFTAWDIWVGWVHTRINPEFIFLGLCYNPSTRGDASRKVWGQICPWFGYSEYCCFHINHPCSSNLWWCRLAYCSTFLGRSWWGECLLYFLFSHIETYSLMWNWELNSWVNAKYMKSHKTYNNSRRKYFVLLSFIVERCINKNIINSNQLMHIFNKKHIKIK